MTDHSFQFKISTVSQADLKLLSYYGLPWPKDDPTQFSEEDMLGTGGVRGMGLFSCIWNYGFLPPALYTIYTTTPLLTSISGSIWIRTFDQNNQWADFTGKYYLPKRNFSTRRPLDLSIQFRALIRLADLP
jgi:hypothetical protein